MSSSSYVIEDMSPIRQSMPSQCILAFSASVILSRPGTYDVTPKSSVYMPDGVHYPHAPIDR